jgi:drug/metabolite transporter (DMT)-like permease
MAVPMVLLTLALGDLPVSLGGLLIALVPISTMLAAHFILDDEPFRARAVPGLLLALVGSALLVGVGGMTVEGVDNLWRGVAFSLSGVALAGIGGALTRRFAQSVPSNELVLPQFTVNTLVLVIVVPLVFGIDFTPIDSASWWLLALIGMIGTTVPFAAFIIAASMNSATRLGLTGYSVPVVAVILAIVFLGERLTPAVAAGAALIVGGVVITERATSHVPTPGVFEAG